MKSILRSIALLCVVIITFTACKKQITDKPSEIASVAAPDPNFCYYSGIGHASRQNDGTTLWTNILLRWFDNVTRVQNIKVKLPPYQPNTGTFILNIDYGQVIYNTGQIRVVDLANGHEVLRATMDVTNKRPLISMYDGHLNPDYPLYDTSYFTYDAMNRIQSIRQHARFHGFPTTGVTTWTFEYDPAGNVVQVKPGIYGGYEFRYDYTKLDSGTATLHWISPATKLLEYLNLFKFEYHHQIVAVSKYEPSGYNSLGWYYQYQEKNSRGNVIAYGTDQNKWYTSWDCYGSNPVTTKNPTQEEFMRMVDK